MYMPSLGVNILQVCAVEHVFQGFGDRSLTRRHKGMRAGAVWSLCIALTAETEEQKDIRT